MLFRSFLYIVYIFFFIFMYFLWVFFVLFRLLGMDDEVPSFPRLKKQ